jgi:hypothetical protein
MVFAAQVYTPLHLDHAADRVVFVFGCRRASCIAAGSWAAIREQAAWPTVPPAEQDADDGNPAAESAVTGSQVAPVSPLEPSSSGAVDGTVATPPFVSDNNTKNDDDDWGLAGAEAADDWGFGGSGGAFSGSLAADGGHSSGDWGLGAAAAPVVPAPSRPAPGTSDAQDLEALLARANEATASATAASLAGGRKSKRHHQAEDAAAAAAAAAETLPPVGGAPWLERGAAGFFPHLTLRSFVLSHSDEPRAGASGGGGGSGGSGDRGDRRELELLRAYEAEHGVVTADGPAASSAAASPGSSTAEAAEPRYDPEPDEDLDPEIEAQLAFHDRVALAPWQCLRYEFGGQPLIPGLRGPAAVPPCDGCGAARSFEFQLMPTLCYYLGVDELHDEGENEGADATMDWGAVLVYTCPDTCEASVDASSGFAREFVHVVPPPSGR